MGQEVVDEMLVKISADITDLKSGMATANKSIESLNGVVKKMSAGLMEGVAAMAPWVAGLLSAKGAIDAVAEAMTRIERISRLSDRLGIDTEALSAFMDGANDTGASAEGLTRALQHLSRSSQEAADGNLEAAKSFEAVGINMVQLIKLSPEQKLGLIADKIQEMGTATERTAFAMKVFGRSGAELVNMLADGSEGLEKMKEEANKLGFTFSRAQGEQVIKAKLAWGDLGDTMEGVANKMAIMVSPALKEMADKLMELFQEGMKDGGALKEAFDNIGGAVVGAIKLLTEFTGLLANIPKLYSEIKGLTKDMIEDSGLPEEAKNALRLANPLGDLAEKYKVLTDMYNKWKAAKDSGADDPYVRKLHGGKAVDASMNRMLNPEDDEASKAEEEAARKRAEAQKAAEDAADRFRYEKEMKAKRASEKEMEDLAKSTQNLRDKLGERTRVQEEKHAEEQKIIEKMWTKGLISTEERDRLVEESEIQHQQTMYRIKNEGMIKMNEMGMSARQDLVSLMDKYKTEEEQLTEHMQRELAIIQDAQAFGVASAEEAEKTKTAIIKRYEEQRKKTQLETVIDGLNTTARAFGNVSSLMQSHNKKAFEVGKMAAYGEAIVSTAAGIARQFKDLPYPAALATSAAVAAAGAVQIATIAGTQFNGGGSAPSTSVGGVGVSAGGITSSQSDRSPAGNNGVVGADTQRITNITIEGRMLHGAELDELVDALNRASSDGAKINARRTR